VEAHEVRRYEGQQVVFGIRPEHVRVAERGVSRAGGVLSVVVERRELLGAESLVRFRLDAPLLRTRDPHDEDSGKGDPWAGERPNTFAARVRGDAGPTTGDPIDLAIDMSRIHLFDPGTARAIA
jgi:multiple sugar transport system ATP-binding protein